MGVRRECCRGLALILRRTRFAICLVLSYAFSVSLLFCTLISERSAAQAPPPPTVDVTKTREVQAYYGQKLDFIVTSLSGDIVTAIIPPNIVGSATFDPSTKRFSYTPGLNSVSDFDVLFTDGNGTKNKVHILVASREEVTFFSDAGAKPDAESTDYLQISSVRLSQKRLFNASPSEVDVRRVSVVAHDLTIKEGYEKNSIYKILDGQKDVVELTIAADRLTIASALHCPGTKLTIRARTLRFEGDGAINTTPLSDWVEAKAATDDHPQADKGNDGESAGDVTVFAASWSANDIQKKRFILNGGNGQLGGKGRAGTKGADATVVNPSWRAKTIYVDNNGRISGVAKWPGDGGDASPGGVPGGGGKAGNLLSNLDISGLLDAKPGLAAPQRPAYEGGPAGTPIDADWVIIRHHHSCSGSGGKDSGGRTCDDWDDVQTPTHHSHPGADAASPIALPRVLALGKFERLQNQEYSWADPMSWCETLGYAQDLYLNGFLEDAEATLQTYSDVTQDPRFLDLVPVEDKPRLLAQTLEIQNLRQRISSNVDYFGNPAGYAPLLSLEANLSAYQNEIRNAIPILYVSYWLSAKERSLEEKKAAISSAMDSLSETVKQDIQSYSILESEIGSLQIQAKNASLQLEAVESELKAEDDRLQQLARDHVEQAHQVAGWRKAIGTLAVLAKVIPVYQPALGIVGQGLETVSTADQGNVFSTIQSVASLPDQLSGDVLKASSSQAEEQLRQLDPSEASSAKAYITSLSPHIKGISEAQRKLAAVNQSVQAPQSEIEAELSKLKSEDPQYQKFVADVQQLQQASQELSRTANATIQRAARKFDDIVTGLAAAGKLSQELSSALLDLDPVTKSYLQEIERRANERLLKYHYYFAKAYVYRTLQRYPHNIRQDLNFKRLVRLASTNVDDLSPNAHRVKLSSEEFNNLKAVYEAPLGEAVQGVIANYNNTHTESADHLSYRLSKAELKSLNDSGHVAIDLQRSGLIRPTEENQRIIGISASKFVAGLAKSVDSVNATLTVSYEHPPISLIRSGTTTYVFRHPDRFVWATTKDLVSNDPPHEVTESPGSSSLLFTLLDKLQLSGKMQLFSEPSLLGPIVISRSVLPEEITSQSSVNELELKIDYDFNRKRSDQSSLIVDATHGLLPPFEVDTTDLSGLSSGRAPMTRWYSKAASVQVTAPETFGLYKFSEWRSGGQWVNSDLVGGVVLGTSKTTTVRMSSNLSLHAVYILPSSQ